MAAEHILHMQKALSQMNLQLHHVLSDITGTSGQAILDAILAGQRDPVALAQLCHRRVPSPRDKVAQALVGDYRAEHLFTLKQSLEGYRYYQKLILELDQETARLMQRFPARPRIPYHHAPSLRPITARATILNLIFGASCTALPASISPTYPALAQLPRKSSSPRSAARSAGSATPRPSPHGLAFVRKNESAAARCCPVKRAR
jgi:hypothetical protein